MVSDTPDLKAVIEYWPYGLAQGGRNPSGLLGLLDEFGLAYEPIGRAEDPGRLDPARPDQYCNLLVTRRNER